MWIITDNDVFQICRELKPACFELYQINSVPIEVGKNKAGFKVSHDFVNVDRINSVEKAEILSCYGYESDEHLKKTYGGAWKQILAEMQFELASSLGKCFIGPLCKTSREASEMIRLMANL